jgi:hypothetical protein
MDFNLKGRVLASDQIYSRVKPLYSPVPYPLFPENRLVNLSKNTGVKLLHQSVKRQIFYWPVKQLVPNEQKLKA